MMRCKIPVQQYHSSFRMKAATSCTTPLFLIDKTLMHCNVSLKVKASGGWVSPVVQAEVRGVRRKKQTSKLRKTKGWPAGQGKNKLKSILTSGLFSLTKEKKELLEQRAKSRAWLFVLLPLILHRFQDDFGLHASSLQRVKQI